MTSKEIFKEMSQAKSQTGGTSLITMYIPSGFSMSLVTKELSKELSTASNIKDKSVRKAVITALKSSLSCVKMFNLHTAPENGLVLCSGETKYCS